MTLLKYTLITAQDMKRLTKVIYKEGTMFLYDCL